MPVVPIQANKGKGLDELDKTHRRRCSSSRAPCDGPAFPAAFESEVAALRDRLGADVPPFLVRRLLLDVGRLHRDSACAEQHGAGLADEVIEPPGSGWPTAGCAVPAVEARDALRLDRQATAGCIERPAKRAVTWTDRIDRVLTHPSGARSSSCRDVRSSSSRSSSGPSR